MGRSWVPRRFAMRWRKFSNATGSPSTNAMFGIETPMGRDALAGRVAWRHFTQGQSRWAILLDRSAVKGNRKRLPLQFGHLHAVFGNLTGEDARPTLWRGRPRPRKDRETVKAGQQIVDPPEGVACDSPA